ncbi:serine protease [Sphaerisporangium siamense]|uniref:Peptidase S1 domain-containing protein n=1 Tax=Sphaerisporangium siamense TaxID=795645 RepID=A0A7W7D3R7_9ACTN|nr:hypothetical protein [Sphaerisporangium siamense]MBB4699556.1 hypothetical protein [Sphaerisporangium siamense]GII86972.1 serine protease [Sphaerisporangium siamense]
MRRRLSFALVTLATTAGLALPMGSAMAQSPEPGAKNAPASTYHLSRPAKTALEDRTEVSKAAKIIRTAVENGANSGYGNIVVTDDAVQLFWKGALPASISSALTDARESVTVEVLPADYSLAELESQAEIIAQDIRSDLTGPVIGVQLAPDSSGLILRIRKDANPGQLGVPSVNVPYTTQESEVPTLTSRQVDTAPYSGGIVLTNQDPGVQYSCSSGFGVTKNNVKYLLTAGHCGQVGSQFRNSTTTVGSATQKHSSHDLLLVSANAAGTIYDGPVTTTAKKGVVGWDYVYSGDIVKSSGATSGTVPRLWVTGNVYALVVNDVYGNSVVITNQIETVQLDGLTPAAGGDSGAPIFVDYGTTGKVVAKGSASAVSGTSLFFQPFSSAVVDFGVAPIPG